MEKMISRILKKTLILLLIMAVSFTMLGCKQEKYSIDENNLYSDEIASFSLPDGHILMVDSTEDMGNAYSAFYTFKDNEDFTGSNIVYMAMLIDDKSMSMMDDTQEDAERSLKDQFREKDQSIEVLDYYRIDAEGSKGYVIEYAVGEFGEEIDTENGIRIMIAATRENDNTGIIMFLNSNAEAFNESYRNCAKSFKIIPAEDDSVN